MIAVLVGPHPGAPRSPEATPIGRAALALSAEGVPVCFTSDGLSFTRAVQGGWAGLGLDRIAAVHDRFPSQTRPDAYRRALDRMGHPPMGNPEDITLLCRDKIASQRWLESGIAMPGIETDPARFAPTLADWGCAFLKPRYGAMGRGIRRVQPGDPLPARGPGAVHGVDEPLFLQRAVPSPASGAIAVRSLVQRLPSGGWIRLPPVARVAPPGEPVANVSTGAVARPAEELLSAVCCGEIADQAERVAEALASRPKGELAVEAGVDFAIDAEGRPVLLEVNSRPRGRLEALAEDCGGLWRDRHVAACGRPINRLWALCG